MKQQEKLQWSDGGRRWIRTAWWGWKDANPSHFLFLGTEEDHTHFFQPVSSVSQVRNTLTFSPRYLVLKWALDSSTHLSNLPLSSHLPSLSLPHTSLLLPQSGLNGKIRPSTWYLLWVTLFNSEMFWEFFTQSLIKSSILVFRDQNSWLFQLFAYKLVGSYGTRVLFHLLSCTHSQ